jgi:site-specific DNA recombinase
MKKAALYARVSSLKQQEEHTIESQLAELKRQIAQHGNVLVKEYIDDGYTGTRLDRPALEQMRQDLKTKIFDVIYFLCPDRIARDVWHQNIVIEDITRHKKRLVINGEDYESNPENYFKLTILGAVAQLERAKIVERTTRGRRHKLRMGQVVSQGAITFGYRYIKKTLTSPAKLEIHEEEAKIVRRIFELYASGNYGLAKIARWLEENNIPTRTGKRMWRDSNVRLMLRNQTYAGTRYYNRMFHTRESVKKDKKLKVGRTLLRDRSEWIGIKVPAIVSQELFNKVQEQIKKRSERYQQPKKHPLLSELVRCGECGHSVSSYTRRVGFWLKIGIRRIHHKTAYLCTWRVAARSHPRGMIQKCKSPEVMSHILENKVLAMIRETMLDASKLKAWMNFFKKDYRADQKRVEWKLMRLDKKLQEVDRKKKRLIDTYIGGSLAHEEYVKQNIELDQELLQVKYRKDELLTNVPLVHQKEAVEISIRQFCDNARTRLEKCRDFDSKRQFLLDHIEKVIYQDTKVIIVGSVPVRLGERSDRGEDNKIEFKIESDFDKRAFSKKDRTRYLVDGRLKEWGSGGRDTETHQARVKELQSTEVKASLVTQQIIDAPLREAVGYTASGRKKLQVLRSEMQKVFASAVTGN